MKLKLPYGLMALTLGLSLMTACGPDDESNNDDNQPLTSDQLFARATDAFINTQCKGIFQCPEQQGFGLIVYGRFKTEAECKAALAAEFDLGEDIKQGIAAGRVKYNAATAQACATKIESSLSASICTDEEALGDEPPECEQLFEGQVAEGGKCLSDDECAGDLDCNFEGGECYGICKVDPCKACTDTQVCVEDNDGNTSCEDAIALGASCTFNDTCVEDASCFYGDAEMGTCIADKSVDDGNACEQDSQCKSDNCDQDGVCAPAPAPTTLGAAGESCTLLGKLCKPGLSCQDVDFLTQAGTCKTVVAAGGECDLSIQCEFGLFCQGADPGTTKGKCASPLANGQACDDDDNCQSDTCDEDTSKCVPDPSDMVCAL